MLARDVPQDEVRAAAHQVRMRLNPRPAGQLALNIPDLDDEPVPGIQHKYPETVLVRSSMTPTRTVSGLCRTVRGPSIRTLPGYPTWYRVRREIPLRTGPEELPGLWEPPVSAPAS